jgi:hypothetical protein
MDTQQILAELRVQRDRLDQAIAAIESLATGGSDVVPEAARESTQAIPKPAKRHISPEGRRRIAEAAKRRWAAQRKGTKPVAKATAGTRQMSPEARKRIGEAMRKRWAERKKGTKAA